MDQPDTSAATLARRRWDSPKALRGRIDAIRREQVRLARKRRELEAKLALSDAAATAESPTAP